MLRVQKYGGSSVSTPEQIKAIAHRLALAHAQGDQILAVVSAMGKSTDQLVALAQQISKAPNRRELDMLLTTGERVTMALLCMALRDLGVPAISLTGSQAGILTDNAHSNARILDIKPTRVTEELRKGTVVVLAGFQGVHPETREITTLGRGGSDTTAVAMAAYFRAEMCEIYKDVDGVYSADPKKVPTAQHLAELEFAHLLEMTFWGAKVLHYRSVELAARLRVPIAIRMACSHGAHASTGTSPGTGISSGVSAISEAQTLIHMGVHMFETAEILALNSHAHVDVLSLEVASSSVALDRLQTFLDRHQLPWPQVLWSEANANQTDIYLTAPAETLASLRTLVEASEEPLRWGADLYCTLTLTAHGAIGTKLPREVAHALKHEQIEVHRMLASSISLTVLVLKADYERALLCLHEFVHPGRPH